MYIQALFKFRFSWISQNLSFQCLWLFDFFFDVGIARLEFQIRPHQYSQCFDYKYSVSFSLDEICISTSHQID